MVKEVVGASGGAASGRRPRPFLPVEESTPVRPGPATTFGREDQYLKARRQLRLWPVCEPLEDGVRQFLVDNLKLTEARANRINFTVCQLDSRPDSPAQDQALVTFSTVRERDEVRSKASNLRGGDKSVGCQLEPPDFLRAQYKSFQNLAFCMKKKNPDLKRNIKFNDESQTLVMDVKMDGNWKTVEYATAKNILKVRSQGTSTITGGELKTFLNTSDVINNEESDESMDEGDNTMVFNTGQNKNNVKACPHSISFMNTNARSLKPKIESLLDCFYEKLIDIATITETWFQTGRECLELAATLRDGHSLGILTRERQGTANNGRQYGGVALVYRLATCRFEPFSLVNPENYEVMASVGNVKGVEGKVFVISCYAPPNLLANTARAMMEYVSDLVCEAKRTFADCAVIVAGDFNQWSVAEILDDHPDLSQVEHGPTRGDRQVDKCLTNFGRVIFESDTLEPLETEEGNESDHRVAYFRAKFESNKEETITYTYRPFNARGAARFSALIAHANWSCVLDPTDVDEKVNAFQVMLDGWMDTCFPLKTITRRKSDPPWVNRTIRRLTYKRRGVYDREGRSPKWKKLMKKTRKLCRERAGKYLADQKSKLTGPGASRMFFKHMKSYNSREKPPDFNVADLYPGSTNLEVAEKLAEHFNAISKEFSGIAEGDIPDAHSNPPPVLTRHEVEARLKAFRKPKSRVKGDIFPSLVNSAAGHLSVPLTDIFNCVSSTKRWPADWKREFVTPIPKKTILENAGDLRNISCTKLFYKVYESFLLNWLDPLSKLRTNQYGGVKGLGTEHYLITLWQKVLEGLDDPRAASLLTSIDYSKAFNRLDFSCCLKALKSKGVSSELLHIVASFLTGRNMTVKVGSDVSLPRTVEGGVPQGSLLGVFLFNVTIDCFEAFSNDVEKYGEPEEDVLAPR